MVRWAGDHPWRVMLLVMIPTLLLTLAAAVPSIWPNAVPWLPAVRVDTDPENMLPADAPVRRFHHEMKERFALYDMVVLGAVMMATMIFFPRGAVPTLAARFGRRSG